MGNRLKSVDWKSEQSEHEDAANEITPESKIGRSKAAYRAELSNLLRTNPRQWVAYADGKLVGIGTSQRELYRICLEDLKLTHDRFIVRRIMPETSPEVEVIER